MKKTHFTEIEVNRLLDIHYQIMVGFNKKNMIALECLQHFKVYERKHFEKLIAI